MEPIIKVTNLTVVYDKGMPAETKAVNNANMEVFNEEFVVIFGPSGCGKSTLLYAITGIEKRVDSGEIWIKGKNLFEMTKYDLNLMHRSEIGIIFQAYNLIPTLSVLDNVALPMIANGINKRKRIMKAKLMLSRFGISQFSHRFPQHLSGGQQQRVGVSRALVNNPGLILADEPTGNLDSRSAEIVMRSLAELNQVDKKTIVLVTHDPSHLVYAHRVVYMKDGMVLRAETKKDVKPYTESWSVATSKTEDEVALEAMSKTKTGTGFSRAMPILLPEKCGIIKAVPVNIQAMSVYFDWRLNEEEEIKLEKILREHLDKSESKNKLAEELDRSLKEGGMGFYSQKAERLAGELGEIVVLSKYLQDALMDGKNFGILAGHVSDWLLKNYGGVVNSSQRARMEEAVVKRIKGEYSAEQFQGQLDLPIAKGGAGLYWHTSKKLARKMEMILG